MDNIFKQITPKGNFDDKLNILELEEVIKSCSDINVMDTEDDGRNILQKIVFDYGYDNDIIKIIEYLIKKGININYQDWFGSTALHLAIYSRSVEIIKLLLNNGGNPNLISIEDSNTVLDFAQMEYCMSEDINDDKKLISIMKLLIEYNGKPRGLVFTNKIDTYLYINTYQTYPTGLFTNNGNIYLENIPNVRKIIQNDFMYWLVNGRPSNEILKNEPEHPFVLEYYQNQKMFNNYFNELFDGKIIVGSNDIELAQKVCDKKKKEFEESRNGI